MSLFEHFHTWTGYNVVLFYFFVYCAASPAAFLHRDHLGISFSCRSETKDLPLGVAQGLRYQLLERLCKKTRCEDNETGYCVFVHLLLVYKHNCPCLASSVCLVCYNSLILIDILLLFYTIFIYLFFLKRKEGKIIFFVLSE